jgi:hypothetical protein
MRRFFFALFTFLGAALLSSGWYVYNKGFTKKWRIFVADEFRKRGVDLSLKKLTLDPMRGLVAREVKVFDATDRKRTLAVVDEMRLVLNWANLTRSKTFLDALDLRDATLSLPLDPENPRGPKIDITRMSGRLFLPPEQIVLNRFEAEIAGIRITAAGRVVNPQAVSRMEKRRAGSSNPAADFASKIVRELNALRFEGREPPLLDLRFSGDLARPGTVFVEAHMRAEKIRRGDLRLESFLLDALYRDRRVALRQLSATDANGALRIHGSYDLDAKNLDVQARSTLDLQPILRTFLREPELAQFSFSTPPGCDATVRASFGEDPSLHVLGRIEAKRFRYRAVNFEEFTADLVLDGERWAARNIRVVHQTGELVGDVMQLPGDFRTRLRSTINPEALAPFLRGKAAEWFRQLDFTDSPSVSLEARGPSPDFKKLSGNAALKLGRSSYRNIAAQSATATLRYADRKLSVDPMRVIRPEGSGEGGLIFDFDRNEVRVKKMRTSVHPQEAIWWVDPKLLKHVAPYRFGKRPPQLLIDGLVHQKDGPTTQLRVDIEAPGGMDYTFLRRDLRFPQISGKLFFTSTRMKIDQLSASLMGGRLGGSADISLKRAQPDHSADLRFENVDFASLTKLYFGYDDSKGRLNARYGFTIRGDDARSMRGRGDLSVTDGQVFAIPFLGPLSGVLNTIVAGMGNDVARQGSANFSIDDGVIDARDFLVEGRGFSMIGGGKLHFLDDKMAFDVRINAKGLPGVFLFPVSKLFEYTATDKLSKPNWRPKVLPRL